MAAMRAMVRRASRCSSARPEICSSVCRVLWRTPFADHEQRCDDRGHEEFGEAMPLCRRVIG
jgi:hypothetical protein